MITRSFNSIGNTGIGIAILVAMAFLPSRAAADCGDYVQIDKNSTSGSETQSPAQHPPLPCNGPNCSSHSATPTPITAPVSESESESLNRIPSPSDEGNERGERFSDWYLLSLPAPLSDSLFHPPRAA